MIPLPAPPPVMDPASLPDKELISAAVKASRLSVRRFSRERLVRDPRTVWRWLAGENDLPRDVRAWCVAFVRENPLPPDIDAAAPPPADEAE
jgi:hypothetical protein